MVNAKGRGERGELLAASKDLHALCEAYGYDEAACQRMILEVSPKKAWLDSNDFLSLMQGKA